MGIPKTYPDGNPDDRDWIGDVWTWLQGQSQTAWLYFARGANWDDMDWLFPQMVVHPDCDRALASWLFWHAQPSHYLAVGERPTADGSGAHDLMALILDRAEMGGWPTRGLHYSRMEVAQNAFDAATELAKVASAPFAIPRELCASFDGSNPPLEMDAQTEADWRELTDTLIDVRITRSDEEALGAHSWIEPALRLPADPVVTAEMSDFDAIEAVFGDYRSTLERIEDCRRLLHKHNPRRPIAPSTAESAPKASKPGWSWPKLVMLLAVVAIGGALIAHRLRTGTW